MPHFNPINKHPHRCLRLTSAGRSFINCDVTTDDGATLYVYVAIYAAIHCEGKSGRASRLHPALLIAVKSRTTVKVDVSQLFFGLHTAPTVAKGDVAL